MSERFSFKEMNDLLLDNTKEDMWKWFYCKTKYTLKEGLTIVENEMDIENLFEVANLQWALDLYVCLIPQFCLVEYSFKNLDVVFKSDEEVTYIYRYHEKAKNDANTMSFEEIDDDFQSSPRVKALDFMNDHEEIRGGCFDDIESYLKKGKLEIVVAIITSYKPNVLGDMNVTLKDPSGKTSGIIHYKVLSSEDGYAKDIKVRSALLVRNVSVFCDKSKNYALNITIKNLVKIIKKEIVVEDADGTSSSKI
uniref:EEIG1/EHBP1 N-terminal domain-containing protein n=1 Tax=Tanacetum cinerariifolium TaxID=118510 RepID=A0A6L2KF14_TANCI|nr:EEIG1/EHBP1 N-terminal domain-containing protein [Tanacetum cinerariifolium]